MSTINISLPQTQVDFIDKMAANFSFANRSEFIRSLLRLVAHQPTLAEKASFFPFTSPAERSTKKIMDEFAGSKKYSKAFLKDLKEGLANSDYFKNH